MKFSQPLIYNAGQRHFICSGYYGIWLDGNCVLSDQSRTLRVSTSLLFYLRVSSLSKVMMPLTS